MKYTPVWARRLGTVGLVVFLFLALVRFAAGAILEAEVQGWWQSYMKPLLALPIEIKIRLWHLLAVVLVIALTLTAYFLFKETSTSCEWQVEPLPYPFAKSRK